MSKEVDDQKKNEYPSLDVMFDISKEEYFREIQRSNTLDNKCSVFMAGIIAVITIFVPLIPFSGIISTYVQDKKTVIVLVTIALCLLFVSALFFLCSFYKFFKSFDLKPYAGVNFENLNDDENLKKSAEESKLDFIKHYNMILNKNIAVNNAKADDIHKGFKYSALAFFLLIISVVCLQFIVGVWNMKDVTGMRKEVKRKPMTRLPRFGPSSKFKDPIIITSEIDNNIKAQKRSLLLRNFIAHGIKKEPTKTNNEKECNK